MYFTTSSNMERINLNLRYSDYSYHTIKPVSIKPGALVEVQVSFCVVPLAKGRHIMLNKLRSICILNRQVIDVSVVLQQNTHNDSHWI